MTPAELRTQRKELGLSQTALASLLGIQRQATISDWENGVHPIPKMVELALRAIALDRGPQIR